MSSWSIEAAMAALPDHRQSAVDRIVTGKVEGRWHPTGFAVFHLGELDDIGRLRLHVWPAFKRNDLDKHPPIHSHAWQLVSLVLKGSYQDTLYRRDPNGDPYRLHQYGYSNQGDFVLPTGSLINLTVAEERHVPVNHFHTIEPGQLHETRIHEPPASTLVVMGPSEDVPLVLAGRDDFNSRTIRGRPLRPGRWKVYWVFYDRALGRESASRRLGDQKRITLNPFQHVVSISTTCEKEVPLFGR